MDILIGVLVALVIVCAFIVGILFLVRLWDYLGRKANNTKKED